MSSTSKSEKVTFSISLLSIFLTIFLAFFTLDDMELVTLSIAGMILLTLGCTIASIVITKAFFSSLDRKQKGPKEPYRKLFTVIVSFLAGALTVFIVIVCVVLMQRIEEKKTNPQPEPIVDIQLSSEELILVNLDFIETKISEYTESDIQEVNNKYVNLLVCENAGNLLYDEGDGTELTCEVLDGKALASAMVIILDYETHEIIRTYYSDERGRIQHYSMGNENFFCVVALPEYELYVSEPVFVSPEFEDEYSGIVGLYLSKPDFKYNDPICIRVKVRDFNQSEQNYDILSDHPVSFRCIESLVNASEHQFFDCIYHMVYTNGSGIISRGGSSTYYFELNTEYELDISPGLSDISSGIIPYFYDSPYKTISDFPTHTNLIDVFVDYDGTTVEKHPYLLK